MQSASIPWAVAIVLALAGVAGCSSETTCDSRCDAGTGSEASGGSFHNAPGPGASGSGSGGNTSHAEHDAAAPGCLSSADCAAAEVCTPSHRCLRAGSCATDADCATGQVCESDAGQCAIGSTCGQSEFELAELPPNVMILLDRSGSMDGDADGDTRWNVAKAAIATLTQTFDDRIRFGLATYSACLSGGCSAGTIEVPIGEHAASAINDFLATTVDERSSDGRGVNDDGDFEYLCDSGDPETSTGKSLAALAGEKSLLDAKRSNAVILLTDGEESEECADDCDGPCGAKKLRDQALDVKTYVIGLGVNPDDIDKIAAAGGTKHAIGANSKDELSDAFDGIAKSVASCDYEVASAPADDAQLYVFFNDDPQAIARGDSDGWSYDAPMQRLRFSGSACMQIESGAVHDIDFVFGCPEPSVD